ncbi:MAG: sigma-70 family RNA polymerase sigma factor [Planctomycetes bacterium]|nr:sigma-70 family RNA polymerase sigma factor [Planctomycetota bacterium]
MQPSSSNVAFSATTSVAGATEAAVLARARGGDRAAFGELIDQHQNRVFTLAMNLCRGRRDDAEELAQEAFLRALEAIAQFRGESLFSTWMHRIVVNLHLNRSSTLAARARDRQLTLSPRGDGDERPTLDVAAPGAAPGEQADLAEQRGCLRAALARLDDDRRMVVILRDVEGKSYEEIAELLAVPIGTVRSRLARAREELSRALGGSGFRGGEAAS